MTAGALCKHASAVAVFAACTLVAPFPPVSHRGVLAHSMDRRLLRHHCAGIHLQRPVHAVLPVPGHLPRQVHSNLWQVHSNLFPSTARCTVSNRNAVVALNRSAQQEPCIACHPDHVGSIHACAPSCPPPRHAGGISKTIGLCKHMSGWRGCSCVPWHGVGLGGVGWGGGHESRITLASSAGRNGASIPHANGPLTTHAVYDGVHALR